MVTNTEIFPLSLKIPKLGKNFVEVDWIWRLYKVTTKICQVIATAYKMGGV